MDTGIDPVKTASKNVIHKSDEFLGNSILDAVAKTKDWKSKKCWRNNYSTRRKRWNIRQIEKIIVKMKHYKISWSLSNSTVLKFVIKNRSN